MSLRALSSNILRGLTHPGSFELTEALFLRLLGLVYVTAFASLWPQIDGLIGSTGIIPASQMLSAIRNAIGPRGWLSYPTLFWFGVNDTGLISFCAIGCLAAVSLIFGFFSRISAAICFVLYLSLVLVAQPFTSFQWDALLLESGFLALFARAPWLVWAYRFLLFRLIFESGLVKLLSGDPNWRNFHALRFHFMTQPLPNPLAYYAYRAPVALLDFLTGVTLAIELCAPFLLFCPRKLRHVGVWLIIILQLAILLTGNYAFFNLLTLVLCIWSFDDRTFAPLERVLARRVRPISSQAAKATVGTALAILVFFGAVELIGMFAPAVESALAIPLSAIAPFEIVNTYGLFAVMTTTRPEIVLEGSGDGVNWREYSFPYKPGNLHRPLPQIAPYQPRLDWQMWFAALGDYDQNRWVGGLIYRLLQADSAVLGLMNPPPFARPPHYIRALLYNYEFTTPDERARTGAVWQRQFLRIWFGPASLNRQ